MNNLKGLAEDESGNTVLEDRLVRSDRFTVGSSVKWTFSGKETGQGGHLDNSPLKFIWLKLVKITQSSKQV